MAIGENESWITMSDNGKLHWSRNIESHYPSFMKKWNDVKRETGYVSQVILGCDEEYFLKTVEGGYWWRLNDSMEKHIDIYENCNDIDVLALGQNGSYIVQLESGWAFWKVDDFFYAGLHNQKTKIENRRIWVRLSPTRP